MHTHKHTQAHTNTPAFSSSSVMSPSHKSVRKEAGTFQAAVHKKISGIEFRKLHTEGEK
jgi:hypothetical protein